jgi:hypothetical protein
MFKIISLESGYHLIQDRVRHIPTPRFVVLVVGEVLWRDRNRGLDPVRAPHALSKSPSQTHQRFPKLITPLTISSNPPKHVVLILIQSPSNRTDSTGQRTGLSSISSRFPVPSSFSRRSSCCVNFARSTVSITSTFTSNQSGRWRAR